jgi:tRNA A-37 threonylcarbamoyl transferase component Bud32
VGHVGDDADTEAEAHIGLDHIRVGRREHDARRQARFHEGLVEARATREAEYVGHDRVRRDVREGQLVESCQRVVAGNEDAAVPAIAGHHDQVAEQLQRLGGDGEIHRTVGRHLGDLHRRALVHVQGHLRVAGLMKPWITFGST